MTRDELISALVVERYAPVTPPPPAPRPAVADDDLDADDYDPDYDLDLCGPGDPGDWHAGRRVETVEIPGVSR